MAENNFGKGIKITSGFDLSAKLPLDNRYIVKTLEERDSHVTNNRAYEGMKVYVLDEKKEYTYDGTEWTEQGGISDEQLEQLIIAYEHSQSKHVTIEDIHTHDNKSVLDNITQEKVDSWDNKSEFDGNYNNLTNKPIIPTKTSELTNDSNFLTSIPSEYITETELNNKGYLTEHQSLEGYAKTSDLHNHDNKSVLDGITSDKVTEWNNKSTFDGNYNNLTNKPAIPSIDGLASETYVDTKISDVVNSAPETLNTLNELAKALGNDENFSTTITTQIGTKVDKVNGKSLIDDTEIERLKNVDNYDDTEILNSLSSITDGINDLEKIESSEIEPTNEMVSLWINTSEETPTNVIARINDDTVASNTTWSSEKINAYIISGGNSGGSGNVDLSAYALKTDLHSHNNKTVLDNITSTKVSEWNNKSTFSGNYNDLTNKPTIPTVPTNISSFTNDSGYITSIPSEYITETELTAKGYATENYVTTAIDNAQLSGGSGETVDMTKYALKTDIPTKTSELTNDSEFITEIPTEYITETELNNKGYLTEHQSLENYAKISDLHSHSNKSVLDNITSDKVTEWNNKSTFSGSYNDLSNKPTIPTVTNDLTNTLKSNYDTAYTHSQSAHAPSNAQKNSDITKTEIEAKLTGNITSHTHSQYLTEHQSLENYALKSEIPTDYITSIPSEYITETELNAKGYATTSQIPTSLPANGGNADTVDGFSIWSGTQAQYDAIGTKSDTTIYLIKEG